MNYWGTYNLILIITHILFTLCNSGVVVITKYCTYFKAARGPVHVRTVHCVISHYHVIDGTVFPRHHHGTPFFESSVNLT